MAQKRKMASHSHHSFASHLNMSSKMANMGILFSVKAVKQKSPLQDEAGSWPCGYAQQAHGDLRWLMEVRLGAVLPGSRPSDAFGCPLKTTSVPKMASWI